MAHNQNAAWIKHGRSECCILTGANNGVKNKGKKVPMQAMKDNEGQAVQIKM
jgi:hypothetical protein